MSSYPNWNDDEARQIAAGYADVPGGLLPALRTLQNTFGYIDERAVKVVAHALNLSRAEVHGVISFYHDFRRTPLGRHQLRLCQAEACQSMGARELADQAKDLLGIDFHGTSPDGAISLDPVYCLGNCACSPSLMIDGRVHGRVSRQRLEALIGELRERADG